MDAIDINILNDIKSDGIAYYRLPDDMYEFFKEVEATETILGFTWDGSRDFGIIVQNKEDH